MERVSELIHRNAVTQSGTGPPAILVHGYGCDQAMWDSMAPYLTGLTLIRYDLTGMGDSDYDSYDRVRHQSLMGHAEDLIEVLDQLDGTPMVAIGHSVSAIIVALAAVQRPDLISSVVMICPNPSYLKDGAYNGGFSRDDIDGLLSAITSNYQGWAGQLASMVAGPDHDAEANLNARFCRNDPTIMEHFAHATFLSDHRDVLPRLNKPTLVLQTRQDSIVPASVTEYVIQQLPKAELVWLDGAGHAPHMTQPKDTAKAILEFLEHLDEA